MSARAALLVILAFVLPACGSTRAAGPVPASPPRVDRGADVSAPIASSGTAPLPLAVRLETSPDPVRVRFERPPRAGLLFDLDTGRVLWRRHPTRVLPIASLTKLMTAMLVAEHLRPRDRVRVTREALAYRGSAIGLLPRGRRVPAEPLLAGLMLPSANDAAIALAQRIAGSVPAFARLMNARARELGLTCTRFVSPDGYARGNHSCPTDLAALARAVLRVPRIARLARLRRAVLPFPIRGGRLHLATHNPLLLADYRGTTGLKTGYTEAAGRCLIATAERGQVRLGVVLLHARDPGRQARRLLDRGFRVARG